jgi:hypothetical protein
LRRILNKRELNYENNYPSAWSGGDARFSCVCRGADNNDHNARDNHSGAPDNDTTDHNHPLLWWLLIRGKYICLRHLRRILNKRELNYENIYPSAWSGWAARIGFVRVGAGHDHNDHNARDNHGGAADSDTTDYDHLQGQPLIASLLLFPCLPVGRCSKSLLLLP